MLRAVTTGFRRAPQQQRSTYDFVVLGYLFLNECSLRVDCLHTLICLLCYTTMYVMCECVKSSTDYYESYIGKLDTRVSAASEYCGVVRQRRARRIACLAHMFIDTHTHTQGLFQSCRCRSAIIISCHAILPPEYIQLMCFAGSAGSRLNENVFISRVCVSACAWYLRSPADGGYIKISTTIY